MNRISLYRPTTPSGPPGGGRFSRRLWILPLAFAALLPLRPVIAEEEYRLVSNLHVIAVSNNAVKIGWSEVANTYQYLIWHNSSNDANNATLIDAVPPSQTTYCHTGLSGSTTHHYWVEAEPVGGGGSSGPTGDSKWATTDPAGGHILRTDTRVNSEWEINHQIDLTDNAQLCINEHNLDECAILALDSDSGEHQRYKVKDPIGNPTTASAVKVFFVARAVGSIKLEVSAKEMDKTSESGFHWKSFDSTNSPSNAIGTDWRWYSATFPSSWSQSDLNALEVGFKPTLDGNEQVEIDVYYVYTIP